MPVYRYFVSREKRGKISRKCHVHKGYHFQAQRPTLTALWAAIAEQQDAYTRLKPGGQSMYFVPGIRRHIKAKSLPLGTPHLIGYTTEGQEVFIQRLR